MKIYIDAKYHCHPSNKNGSFREVETNFFDGKCQIFIEGYCYDDSKGYIQIYPWKLYDELDAAQRTYEQAKLTQYKTQQNELITSYNEGVNSI